MGTATPWKKHQTLIDGGMSALDAHFAVSLLLGHERSGVTSIYLASVRTAKAKTTKGSGRE